MSTKASIVYREPRADEPSAHVYEDVLDGLGDAEPTVYVEISGAISVTFETLAQGRAAVTIGLPRKTAQAIGLIPAPTAARR